MDVTEQDWSFISQTLQNGPADGLNIVQHAQSHGVWYTLYLATRESQNALQWRVLFGRPSIQDDSRSVVQLAIQYLTAPTLQHAGRPDREKNIEYATKVIANCCADNNENRRHVIDSGGIRVLMLLLANGYDPNFVVPTMYNVCAELEDPAQDPVYHESTGQEDALRVTMAEERLATMDGTYNSVLAGTVSLLGSLVVNRCSSHTADYLADLVEMATRPAAVIGETITDPHYPFLQLALPRLMAADGGCRLAHQSARCRLHICRALLAISHVSAVGSYLAATGEILNFALTAYTREDSTTYFGDDEEEQLENTQALSAVQTAMLQLVYKVCQLPEFTAAPKYAAARQALRIIHDSGDTAPFTRALAYIILYNFVDGDTRANLLAAEGVLSPLMTTLQHDTDKVVLYPALGLASKLAVTWRLRTTLRDAGALTSMPRMLTAPNLGYEIPLTAITFIELMIKGHPDHVPDLIHSPTPSSSTIHCVFNVFDKGQDLICVEIGRLLTEICSTLAQVTTSFPRESGPFSLADFVRCVDNESFARVLAYMTTKAVSIDPPAAQRTWFTLGLLSTIEDGRRVLCTALQDGTLRDKVQEYQTQSGTPEAENVKFMVYHLQQAGYSMANADDKSLDTAMQSMVLN